MDCIRNWVLSVKSPQGTPLRLTTSRAIKQQWFTLDHWTAKKTVVGFKKTTGSRKNRMKL